MNACVPFGLPVADSSQPHIIGRISKRGKNVDILPLIDEAVKCIDGELEIIRMELAERFASSLNPVSNVRWAATGAQSKILDFACALFKLGELETCDGTKLSFGEVVRALGFAFNVNIRNPYNMQHHNRNRFKGADQFLRRLAVLLAKDAEEHL